MNPLPQTTIERIEREAEKRFPVLHISENAGKNSRRNQRSFIEGASWQATRALPLYEALKRAIGVIESECDDIELLTDLKEVAVKYSLPSYDAGEAPQQQPADFLGYLKEIGDPFRHKLQAPEPGKEAKEFAEWLVNNYTPCYDIQGRIAKYTQKATWGPFYPLGDLYNLWQQSKNQQR